MTDTISSRCRKSKASPGFMTGQRGAPRGGAGCGRQVQGCSAGVKKEENRLAREQQQRGEDGNHSVRRVCAEAPAAPKPAPGGSCSANHAPQAAGRAGPGAPGVLSAESSRLPPPGSSPPPAPGKPLLHRKRKRERLHLTIWHIALPFRRKRRFKGPP